MTEFEWIDRYLKPLVRSAGAQGLANDVAIMAAGKSGPLIVTMDTLVAGIHFLEEDAPDTVARKLMRVNVSDILCKGALPKEAMLSVAIPRDMTESDLAAFCAGLGADLEAWGVDLIGGDTVSTTGPLTVTLTLTGECLAGAPTTRSSAQPGDLVFVSGTIGEGTRGLEDARAGRKTAAADFYHVPELAPLAAANLVAQFATASIDVSDGLVSDVGHIAVSSGVGIEIALDTVPFCERVETPEQALELATGGDDYQILMTIRRADRDAFVEAVRSIGYRFTEIGEVTDGAGVALSFRGKPVATPDRTGFSH